MMGISLGPITGQLVGEVLRGEKPSIDLRHLSPDRFANS
jgi:glycine/D-amino acid oxidase-like deaminating enzyme